MFNIFRVGLGLILAFTVWLEACLERNGLACGGKLVDAYRMLIGFGVGIFLGQIPYRTTCFLAKFPLALHV